MSPVAVVTRSPANLGTPTTLVGTNISGTAANLTAGHVTTIPNLTGDVTSTGNVTTLGVHGAAFHTDITRSFTLKAHDAGLDSGTLVTLGSTPGITAVVQLADAATQGCYWTADMPSDYTSGNVFIRPIWAAGSTDATPHTVKWSVNIKGFSAGDVTAAGATTSFTGTSAARTANNVVLDEAVTDTTAQIAATLLFRLGIRRIGADVADTYVGAVNLIGVQVTYTASQ